MAKGYPLSKSALQAGAQCPRMLWIRYNMPRTADLRGEDESGQEQFAIGNLVGEAAQAYYENEVGQTVVINTDRGFSPDNYASYAQETADYMSDPNVICIAEATFYTGDLVVFVDLLHRNPAGGWDIVEVKATNRIGPVHVRDASWQTYVARELCGVDIRNTYLMHPYAGWKHVTNAGDCSISSAHASALLSALQNELGFLVPTGEEPLLFRALENSIANEGCVFPSREASVLLDVLQQAQNSQIGANPTLASELIPTLERIASPVPIPDNFELVDDFTNFIYNYSTGAPSPETNWLGGKTIAESIDILCNVVNWEHPPVCTCEPGYGVECCSPYRCNFVEQCRKMRDEEQQNPSAYTAYDLSQYI